MNTHYKLRVTLEGCEADHVVALIGSVTHQYAYVKEIGHVNEKPHMHLYLIVPPMVKEDTLRTKLRKLTGSGRGNKLYSLVKLDTEEEDIAVEYLAYMFKEGEVVAIGFTDAWLEKARAYDLQVKTEMREKKEKRKSRFVRLNEYFEERFNLDREEEPTVFEVYDIVYDFMLDENCSVSISTVSNHVNTLMMRYSESYKTMMFTKVMSQLTVG